ncbi:hypothetical protein HDU93_001093 [Gonapodya sp. JEL0774]|nr:hypothetical protein HDU93_001093 [Gonapodya sp. JEL0774]
MVVPNSAPLESRTENAESPSAFDPLPRFSFLALPPEIQEKIALFWTDFPLGLPTDALNTHLSHLFDHPSAIARRAIARFGKPARALAAECRSSVASPSERRLIATDILIQLCDASNGHLDNAFFVTCEKGDLRRTQMLLTAGVDQRSRVLDAALVIASTGGNIAIMELLLSTGADVHTRNEHAIRCSARSGHTEAIRLLLHWGADLNPHANSALFVASGGGNLEVVRLILETIPNVSPLNMAIALSTASESGAIDVVSYLLSKGAMIEFNGFDAFRKACEHGHAEVARTLLDSDAGKVYLEIPNILETMFREAIPRGHVNVVRLLADRGVDFRYDRNRALRSACQKGHIGIVRVLLSKGVDIHTPNNDALHRACGNGHSDVVNLLLEHGADIHANREGPLRWAIAGEKVEIVKLLIERGANVSAAQEDLVRRAKRIGNAELVRLLVHAADNTSLGGDALEGT